MKGKTTKKEGKKAKADGTAVKVQSDYQKEKNQKSTIAPIVPKQKK